MESLDRLRLSRTPHTDYQDLLGPQVGIMVQAFAYFREVAKETDNELALFYDFQKRKKLSCRFHLQKCDTGRIFPAWLPPLPPPPPICDISQMSHRPPKCKMSHFRPIQAPLLNATYVAFV